MTEELAHNAQEIFFPPFQNEMVGSMLETLLKHSDDAIFSKDLENIIISWSRGAERMYGYTASQAIGQSVTCLVPTHLWTEVTEIQEIIKQGRRVDHLETVRCTKSGELLNVQLNVSPIFDHSGKVLGAITMARDITTTRRYESSIRQMENEAQDRLLVMETANRVALGILSSQTGHEALKHIVEAARTLVGAQYAALGVGNPDGGGLTEFITLGLTPEEEAEIGPHPKGLGMLGHLLHRREPLRLDQLTEHPSSVGFPAKHPPMTSFLGIPILRGDTVVGSLYLTNKLEGQFTEADEQSIQALGAHAAVAIYNFQMISQQRALVRGLIGAQEEERRAVAYDLHDGLTQFVMASHAHLEAFRRAYSRGNQDRAERELDLGLHYLQEAVLESRRLISGLRSLALDDLGLAGAVEQMMNEEKTYANWRDTEFLHNIASQRFEDTLETTVYRVIQEALTNARKHARTESVRVLLLLESNGAGQTLRLEVRDWGKGFAPDEKIGRTDRVGLHSMAERVSLIGGTYDLQSALGEGTIVRAILPAIIHKTRSIENLAGYEGVCHDE